jgi:hypothetical protein
MSLTIILLVAAFILFLLAGFKVGEGRVSLGWLGAACSALAALLGRAG